LKKRRKTTPRKPSGLRESTLGTMVSRIPVPPPSEGTGLMCVDGAAEGNAQAGE